MNRENTLPIDFKKAQKYELPAGKHDFLQSCYQKRGFKNKRELHRQCQKTKGMRYTFQEIQTYGNTEHINTYIVNNFRL